MDPADPWIMLAAIALRTTPIKLGPMVTPLPRRRPWNLARETVTLVHLCGGRLILGIGLGSDYDGEYHDFGEVTDTKQFDGVYPQQHGRPLTPEDLQQILAFRTQRTRPRFSMSLPLGGPVGPIKLALIYSTISKWYPRSRSHRKLIGKCCLVTVTL